MILNKRTNTLCVWHDIRKGYRKMTVHSMDIWNISSAITFDDDGKNLYPEPSYFLEVEMPWFNAKADTYYDIINKVLDVRKDLFDGALYNLSEANFIFDIIRFKNAEFLDKRADESIVTATEVFLNWYKVRMYARFSEIDTNIDQINRENASFINELVRHNRNRLINGIDKNDFAQLLDKLVVISTDYQKKDEADCIYLTYQVDILDDMFNLLDTQIRILETLKGLMKQNKKAIEERDRFDWSNNSFAITFEYLSSKRNTELTPSSGSKWGDYLRNFDMHHKRRKPQLKLQFYTVYHFKQDEHAIRIIDHFNANFKTLNALDKANFSSAMFKNQVIVKNRSVVIPYCMHTYDLRLWDNLGYVISVDFVEAESVQELALWEVFSILYFHYNLQIGLERNYVGVRTMQTFLDAGGTLPHYTNPFSLSTWQDIFEKENLFKWIK